MKEIIESILHNYNHNTNTNRPSSNVIMNQVKRDLPAEIMKNLALPYSIYKTVGSYGAGVITETPWVALFDQRLAQSAKRGFYIVYLFKKDMSGVYLSLNQGTTYLTEKFKGKKPREKMKQIAEYIRDNLELTESVVVNLDLVSITGNAKNYEAANIAAYYYDFKVVPDNHTLIQDLNKMISYLNQIRKLKGMRDHERFLDDVIYQEIIDDSKFQEDTQLARPASTPVMPRPPKPRQRFNNTERWSRDPAVAKEALEKANYICEIDSFHETFISHVSGKRYMEAHHLIPLSLQEEFDYDLDVPGNIVSLCPNCHRKIHHAHYDEKANDISYLFRLKKQSLEDFGIHISSKNLLKKYRIE